ncbi:ABC transporter [Candidatus Bathyarchaeota archaeon]|nr:MAG: ABC transporter [Candidatus Bathyarchaeota archaeon]
MFGVKEALNSTYVMWYRQVKRFIRARSRLVGSIAQPLVWMIFFGVGFASSFRLQGYQKIFGGIDYLSFLIPGVVIMAVFFTSFTAGISVIWDKEFGFLKEVLVAPTSRTLLIFGRALGDSTVAAIQGFIVLALAYLLVPNLSMMGIPLLILTVFLVALSFTSLGIVLASKIRSMEGFQLLMTFIAMPILFLSGAFFPVKTMPEWMKILAFLDPLTYGVDVARVALTGVGFFPLTLSFIVLLGLTVAFTVFATCVFRKVGIE